MSKIFNNLLNSFTTDKEGFSARKLSAFVGVTVAIIITFRLPESERLHVIYAWQIFALLCLGIVTVEQIIRLKNGDGENKVASSENNV
jgi:hypothetical protein